ncbi:hypothetical protein COCCADRAFT_31210 [Bipolaris zeicola 26-R-13]|uniref:DDE-1 domain-containing protein n=1 Tax=Cochliobolus carbonum (strain 26-R-13) TaxID=930089 RepID=W6XJE8_COCC2|nr:uncharacterized protein COCCADRAFT_31210 [Bipolaris zeicola 26-R-13]EUC27267.1 hypothetical protein COCCADRAFT_31210 [Bipolaris zeicola 26-R-13]
MAGLRSYLAKTMAQNGSNACSSPRRAQKLGGKPRVLVCDGFGMHRTLEILQLCLSYNIILCCLSYRTSHKLQLCDVGPFAPLKSAYREQVERLNQRGVDVVGKEHFTYLYGPARDRALTKRNIGAEWSTTGLFPFDPERVLGDAPRYPVEVSSNILNLETEAMSTNVLEVPDTPITPVTSVTTEALASLRDLTIKDILHSIKPVVLVGKAKVMSFEDLEEAGAKRGAKEQSSGKQAKARTRAQTQEQHATTSRSTDGPALAKSQSSSGTDRCA